MSASRRVETDPSPARVVELEVDAPEHAAEEREHDPGADSPRQKRAAAHETQPELCIDVPLELRVEALLMTTERPLPESRLAEIIGVAGKGAAKRIVAAIETLNEQYQATNRSFRAERLAGGWQLLTLPEFGPLLHRLHEQKQQTRLSQPAVETLAIVAYRQPIMRAEIEAIRGVASGEVLRSLMERRLVKITGRAEELGRPMLYGTTNEFLKVFGLASVDDLPQVKGLNLPLRKEAPKQDASETATSAPGSSDDTDSASHAHGQSNALAAEDLPNIIDGDARRAEDAETH